MEPLIEQLQILARRLSLLNAPCCGEEVSTAQCCVLREVGLRPGSSMQSIAEQLGVDITTFSRQIKSLETKGLVTRRISPGDRRVSLLELTPTGVTVLYNIDDYMAKRIVELFECMSNFERETVARSLAFLNDAMAVIDETGQKQSETIACCK